MFENGAYAVKGEANTFQCRGGWFPFLLLSSIAMKVGYGNVERCRNASRSSVVIKFVNLYTVSVMTTLMFRWRTCLR